MQRFRGALMTTILLAGKNGSAQVTLERDVELKIVGAAISAGGPLLASYQDHAWQLGTARFDCITCRGKLTIAFQGRNGSFVYGPFSELTLNSEAELRAGGVTARYDPLEEVWTFGADEAATVVVKPGEELLAA
jgi:hypothetical protein